MLEYLSSTWLVHAASIVYVAAFLVRDQLILRSLVPASYTHLTLPTTPYV